MSYSDNLSSKQDGVTLRDYNHASKLYTDNNLKFAPKQKFLYHCFFAVDPSVGDIVNALTEKYGTEIGMLVKSSELPRYTAQVETKNKYNRKKNIQTSIQYEPITITFHDDNHGVTTALLEAYYRFYYADAWHGDNPGAYSKLDGDTTYKGSARHQYRYGLDNNISVPFFRNIQLSQLSRSQYTTYTLVNPIITNWQHDSVESEGNSFMQNTITVAYEAVHYTRGTVEAGTDGNPTGYGLVFYDTRPSPLSVVDPSNTSSTEDLAVKDTRFITVPTEFDNGTIAYQSAAVNPNYSLRSGSINENIGGLSNIQFPKARGTGGVNDITSASSVSISSVNTTIETSSSLLQNPEKLNDLAKQAFKESYLASGGGANTSGLLDAWNNLPEGEKEVYRQQILESAA